MTPPATGQVLSVASAARWAALLPHRSRQSYITTKKSNISLFNCRAGTPGAAQFGVSNVAGAAGRSGSSLASIT